MKKKLTKSKEVFHLTLECNGEDILIRDFTQADLEGERNSGDGALEWLREQIFAAAESYLQEHGK